MSMTEKIQKNIENIVFAFVILLAALISVLSGDSLIAVFAAVCGLSYTILAGKGKFYCYLIGMCGTLCYAYTAFKNTLYGNCALYALYYFPMEIIGVINWRKNLNAEKTSVVKTRAGSAENLRFIAAAALLSLVAGFLMKYTGNKSPFLDAFATVFSIYGMYLTVKRCIEQWDIWLFVNVLSLIMWLKAYINGHGAAGIAFMWLVYCFLAGYFKKRWCEELANSEKELS